MFLAKDCGDNDCLKEKPLRFLFTTALTAFDYIS